MQEANRLFPETLRARVPRGLPAAVAAAARRRCTTPSEWMRQCMLRSLEAEGIRLDENWCIERCEE
jgi:hypothetical protein